MPKLLVDNVWATLDTPDLSVKRVLSDIESGFATGYGVQHATKPAFFSGLVPRVVAQLPDEARAQLVVSDTRAMPVPRTCFNQPPTFLRDYQRAAVNSAIKAVRGIIKAPTGAGKSAIAAGLVAVVPIKWVVVLQRPDLVLQLEAWMRKHLPDLNVGVVHGDRHELGSRVTLGTFHSMTATPEAREVLANAEGLLVDECHRVASTTGVKCAWAAKKAVYRIGLSATPFDRTDGRNAVVEGLLGPVVYEIPVMSLVSCGQLSNLSIHWIDSLNQDAVGFRGSYKEVYDNFIVHNSIRNDMIANAAVYMPKPVLVLVKQREHADELLGRIKSRCDPKNVAYVDGDVKRDERVAIMNSAKHGEVDIIVATAVFYEGVDIPPLRTVIVAKSGASSIEAVQVIGRASRVEDDKSQAHIVDFADQGNKWLLEHTLERYRAYQSAGWTVKNPFPGLTQNEGPTDRHGWYMFVALYLLILIATLIWGYK